MAIAWGTALVQTLLCALGKAIVALLILRGSISINNQKEHFIFLRV